MSEENNQSPQRSETAQNPESWEAQLQLRTNELLTQRIAPLKAEIERLQSTINEISSRLLEQTQITPIEEETSGLLDYVRQWFNESNARAEENFGARLEQAREEAVAAAREEWENDLHSRLDEARNEAAAAAREEWERDFQTRIEEARREGEYSAQQRGEESFQRRLELACDEASAVARRESEAQIEDIREQLEASRKALTIAVSSAPSASAQAVSFDHLKAAVDEIDSQRTQSDTLTSLVRRAAQFAPRIVFFIVKGGDAVGWKANGFDNGLNDETVRLLSVPTQNKTLLREAFTTFSTSEGRSSSPGENSEVLGRYGSPAPERAIAVPLVVRGKAAAVLYADSGTQSEASINIAAIEALMRVASMGIELLPARRGLEPPRPPVVRPSPPAVSPVSQISEPTPAYSPSPASPAVSEKQFDQASQAPAVHSAQAAQASQTQERSFEEPAKPVEQPVAQPVEYKVEPPAVPRPTIQSEPMMQGRVTEDLLKPRRVAESRREEEGRSYPPDRYKAEPQARTPAEESVSTPISTPEVSREFESDQSTPANVSESSQIETPIERPIPPPPSVRPRYPFDSGRSETNEWSAPAVPMISPDEPESSQLSTEYDDEEYAAPSSNQQVAYSPIPEPPRPPQPPQPAMMVPTPASETEQRAHNDARRFARLLVSEIKLYNATKVNEGRRNFDLYDRLKEEIDRSRKVYDKRVSPAVATRFDYFYDELVQTLAEGDPAKLGPACPGPVVIAS